MEITLDVAQLIHVLFHRLWVVFLSALLLLIVAIMITLTPNPNEYEAQATVYSTSAGTYNSLTEATVLMHTYAQVIDSYRIAQRAAVILDLDTVNAEMIRDTVHVTNEPGSPALTISATAQHPGLAVACANAVAEAFIFEIKGIMPESSVQILDRAINAAMTYSGTADRLFIRISYAVAGIFLSVLVIVLREVFRKDAVSIDASF